MNEESTLNEENGELPRFPPPKIKDYQLIKLIGEGSFGQVWLALDATDSPCALKIIYKEKSKKDLFWKEFEGVKNYLPISRSNLGLVTVLHVGKSEDESFYYYTMELADDLNNNDNKDWSNYEAKSLSSHIEMQAEPSPLNEFENIALNLSNGLAHLHENGLVHRDIKPSNVIFVNGVAKLADIGLVSFGSDASTFIGTTGYIPPEGPGSPQADVYALGKTLYELLTAKSVQFFPELPTTVFNDKKHSDQFSKYNLIISQATSPDYRDRPEDGGQLKLLFSKKLKQQNHKQKPFDIGSYAFLVVVVVCFVLALGYGFSTYQNRTKLLDDFSFKHFRYYDSSGQNLLHGEYELKKNSTLSIFCTFMDGLLTKAVTRYKDKTHSALFFEQENLPIQNDLSFDEWGNELTKVITGEPITRFPHTIHLLRQFDDVGKIVTEASFRDSLITKGRNHLQSDHGTITQGTGKLIWYAIESNWKQVYKNGLLVKSDHSRNKETYLFEKVLDGEKIIQTITLSSGATIKVSSTKRDNQVIERQTINYTKNGKVIYSQKEDFDQGKITRSKMSLIDPNNQEINITSYFTSKHSEGLHYQDRSQFKCTIKMPVNR